MYRRSTYEPSSSPPIPQIPTRRRSSQASSPSIDLTESSRKRRRTTASSGPSTSPPPRQEAEAIDLTDVEDSSALAKALAKQREDAVKAQTTRSPETTTKSNPSALSSYKCPVCMDTAENATTTACGHLFCHKCIMDTLKFGEEQRADMPGKQKGTCPVCRKPLSRSDGPGKSRNLVPLLFTKRKKKSVEAVA